MNADYIKEIIRNSIRVTDMKPDAALAEIATAVTKTYVLNGLQRQLSPDGFAQEIEITTTALYNELVNDPQYAGIRIGEISYIFSEGTKGRLGTDKDVVITAKSLLRWIEGYLKHDERRAAVYKLVAENYVEPKRQITTQRVYTEDDIAARIEEAYADYKEWKQRKIQPSDRPKRIGELMEPYLVKDLGGRCMEYLVRNGYAKEGERFADVLERRLKNDGRLERI